MAGCLVKVGAGIEQGYRTQGQSVRRIEDAGSRVVAPAKSL